MKWGPESLNMQSLISADKSEPRRFPPRATVPRVVKSDMTEATEHAQNYLHWDRIKCHSLENSWDRKQVSYANYVLNSP